MVRNLYSKRIIKHYFQHSKKIEKTKLSRLTRSRSKRIIKHYFQHSKKIEKTKRSRLTRWVDRLLPFHFSVEHVPGKNMGFADYLTRNPTGEAIQPTDEDKNFVINTIEEIKLFITRISLSPNGASNSFSPKGAINSTNQYTDDIELAKNDVINPKHTSNKTNNARFCHNTLTNQSHINSHSLNPNSNFKLLNKNIVGITTRRNPNKDTFNIPIKRRFRATNKIKNPQVEQPSHSETFTSCSTQTEFSSNKGKGLDPLDYSKHENLFDAYKDLPTPAYRENFNKVFNEEFMAEGSQQDLKPIIDSNTKLGRPQENKPVIFPH